MAQTKTQIGNIKMKNRITVLALTIAFACSAHATSNDNSGVQKQIDDLRAGLHDVHMNTLQKYSESWGLEDRGNIAKLQENKLEKSVFTADQARQDKALADSITKQAATDSKQTSDLKSYADKKADSAYSTSVAHTDSKVARADVDRAKGDAALQSQITGNLASQSDRDAGQDKHLNAVQDAAQTANDRASNLEVRADFSESAIRETNTQLEITDKRSQNNAVRLDGAESVNTHQETRITQNSGDIVQLYSNGEYAQSRIDTANANIEANRAAQVASNKRIAANTQQLADHEQRLGGLEQRTNRGFADMGKRIDRVQDKANAGVSAAFASAGIPQVTDGQRFAMGAGIGGYEGESALAVGFSTRVTHAVVLKASVASDSQSGFGYNAGVSVGW